MRHAHRALLAALALLPALTQARPVPAPARAGPYSVELTDEQGHVLPTFLHDGRSYVLGARGDRYLVHVRNGSPRRAEVVISVDGRDAIDGEPSALGKRGYLVDAWSEATIDGFRLSQEAVAAFRFSPVSRSYAAQRGDARDVGVIGVAVFPERVEPRPPVARPWWRGWGDGEPRDRRSEQAPSAAPAPPPALDKSEADRAGAAPPSAQAERRADARRPGLGTEFGERHESHVQEVPFVRASSQPAALLTLRYDDRSGLVALGIDLDGRCAADDAWLRRSADPFRRDAGYAQPPPGWRP